MIHSLKKIASMKVLNKWFLFYINLCIKLNMVLMIYLEILNNVSIMLVLHFFILPHRAISFFFFFTQAQMVAYQQLEQLLVG